MGILVLKDKTETDSPDIVHPGNHRKLERTAVPLNPDRVHLNHERWILDHDGFLLDPDKTGPCSKIILGKGLFQPVEIYLPADIINPVKTKCNHGSLPPSGKLRDIALMNNHEEDKTLQAGFRGYKPPVPCGSCDRKISAEHLTFPSRFVW
jgi:hypothetical protein